MNLNKKTGAELLVQTLEKINVDTAFGIPGVHNLKIYDALSKSNIRHITTRNESGAGFMADGYGRRTGRPGTAIVITGPGLTNILTPMGQAYLDSVPMVVISSQLPTSVMNQSTGTLHELKNSTIMASSVAKESRRVPSVEQIESYVLEAYELAVSGRPGPVHLEVPLDLLSEYVSVDQHADIKFSKVQTLVDEEMKTATEWINQAKSIGLIVGGGSVHASEEVEALANKLDAIVLQTAAGKGVISDRNILSLGARLPYSNVRNYLESLDIILAIGTQLAPTDLWDNELKLKGKMIQIDLDAAAFYRNYRADLGIKGDSKKVLSALIEKVDKKQMNNGEHLLKLKEEATSSGPKVTGNHKTFDMAIEVLGVFRKVLKDHEALIADMTTPAYIALSDYKTYGPRTFLHPVGFGTLGYSVPAAIGVKAARPSENLIALIGDGGFQFTMQEIAVACENKLAIPIVIWNNDGYGEIKRNESAMGFDSFIAVDNKNPDFMHLAKTYGIEGLSPTNKDELEEALLKSFDNNQPTIIELNVKWWGEKC